MHCGANCHSIALLSRFDGQKMETRTLVWSGEHCSSWYLRERPKTNPNPSLCIKIPLLKCRQSRAEPRSLHNAEYAVLAQRTSQKGHILYHGGLRQLIGHYNEAKYVQLELSSVCILDIDIVVPGRHSQSPRGWC